MGDRRHIHLKHPAGVLTNAVRQVAMPRHLASSAA